ncbi:MAG: hypothetical protein GX801_01325 [Fibrobacter sp.]|nr:hypothetical protein [Fibrobacter sp.]
MFQGLIRTLIAVLLVADLGAVFWAQGSNSQEFSHRLLAGMSASGKSLGVRQVSRNSSGEIVLPRSAFRSLCAISPDETCFKLTTREWYSASFLKSLGIDFSYDPTLVQVDIILPPSWAQKVRATPRRDVDESHYRYSRNYLEFLQREQYSENEYGNIIKELLRKADTKKVADFRDENWFFADSIVELGTDLQEFTEVDTTTQSAQRELVSTRPKIPIYTEGEKQLNDEILQELRGMRSLLEKISDYDHQSYLSEGQFGKIIDSIMPAKDSVVLVNEDSTSIMEQVKDSLDLSTDTVDAVQDSINAALEAKKQYEELRNMSKDDFFEQAFGRKPTPKPSSIVVKLFVDGVFFENTEVNFSDNRENYSFSSPHFKNMLRDLISEETFSELNLIEGNVFKSELLTVAQIAHKLDENKFELYVDIPGSIKKLMEHDLSWKERYTNYPFVQPATVSSFLNLTLLQEVGYRELFFANDSLEGLYRNVFAENGVKRYPNKVFADFALNINGWVFESQVDFVGRIEKITSYNKYLFKRRFARLVKDYPHIDTRFIAGELSHSTSYIKSALPLTLGVGVEKKVGKLQEYSRVNLMQTTPVEVALDAPAKVEIYVNDKLVRTEHLSSGLHVFKNIPGGIGQNDLRVLVLYDDGRTQEINDIFSNSGNDNLPQGLYEYDANFGFAQGAQKHVLHYGLSSDSLVLSGVGRYGITSFLTGEAYGVLALETQMAGFGLLMQRDSINQYVLRAIGSYNKNFRGGYRLELLRNWRYVRNTFSLGGALLSSSYPERILGPTKSTIEKMQLTAVVGAPIWRGILNASLQANFNRHDTISNSGAVEYLTNLSYNVNIISGLNLSLGSYVRVHKRNYQPQISATINYFFNTGRHSFFAMEQIARERVYNPATFQDYRYVDERGLYVDTMIYEDGYWDNAWRNNLNGGWSWSKASGLNMGQQYSVSGGWQHAGSALRANAFHTYNWGQIQMNYSLADNAQSVLHSRSHYGVGRFETSFSYADGLWGIGRPIRNNFALVKGQDDLAETRVRINPDENNDTEFSHSLGPVAGVFGDIPYYRSSLLQLKLVNPDLGAWLEDDAFAIKGLYKQGYAIKVGRPPKILLRGQLLDETGEALARVAFSLVEKDNPDKVVLESFTNLQGSFQLGDIEPGKEYIIVFSSDVFIENINIKTNVNDRGVVDLKPIKVKHQALGAKLSQAG